MSTAVHWAGDEIDDALAADFDGSLSGLGMELGTSSFNMSEALMALPSLKSETHHSHNHHQSHGSCTTISNHNHSDENARHSPVHHSQSSNSSHKGNNGETSSTPPLTLSLANHSIQDERPIAVVHGKKNRLACGQDEDSVSSGIKRFCVNTERETTADSIRFLLSTQNLSKDNDSECNHEECLSEIRCQQRHSNSVPDLRTTTTFSNAQAYSGGSSPSSFSPSTPSTVLTQILAVQPHQSSFPASSVPEQRSPHGKNSDEFQYFLGAATSMATKLHEETMTYLNQGQSYEIKLKRVGDLSDMQGKFFKSIIRVGFHERRLQFMERDLIQQWKHQRQSDRILEIDIPLSYGVFEVYHDHSEINKCEFLWDPTKETGVFVKVNCISTEFTPKKHGGEKGVPFRLIIETHVHSIGVKLSSASCVHAASCQVKVFKPKGADRKHKTDREKMSKRPQSEQDKFQPSYDCTVFREYPLDALYWPSTARSEARSPPPKPLTPSSPVSKFKVSDSPTVYKAPSKASTPKDLEESSSQGASVCSSPLSSEAKAFETALWLQQNRFDDYVQTFSNFSGSDILRLTREDLIQICGLTDGIRLYNALHRKTIRPRLTIYVCTSSGDLFRAIYLENLVVDELKQKLVAITSQHIKVNRICTSGPADIKVLVTDDVLKNLAEESMFNVDFAEDPNDENAFNATLTPRK